MSLFFLLQRQSAVCNDVITSEVESCHRMNDRAAIEDEGIQMWNFDVVCVIRER